MINKKAQANIQLILVILSTFAFAYIMHQSDGNFKEAQVQYNSLQQKKADLIANLTQKFITQLIAPMIPLVSAEGTGLGCCAQTLADEPCAVTLPSLCTPGRLFSANTMCEQTSFCKTGCCVDDSAGTCDKNVIQGTCKGTWTADKNCNLPQCQLGCCNLGNSGILATQKQCDIYTQIMVLGDNKQTDWDSSISEAACVMSSLVEVKGACISTSSDGTKNCKMITNKECLSETGTLENFVQGKLCTSPSLNTICKKTTETTCVDGKDGVYFKDSCGNPTNIYDSSKANDATYWDSVVLPKDSCGVGSGNANSKECGNCDRFLGGKCSVADKTVEKPTFGNNYCKQTSCLEDGVLYKNGESWCVYDGAIGNGDDVAGSRHWRHVCSLGTIVSEPCADYRNQICVQSNTLEAVGDIVDFRQAFCRPNMWKECLGANSQEAKAKVTAESKADVNLLDCVTKKINGGGSYNLEFFAPKYAPGFDLSGGGALASGDDICSMASLTCTKVMVAKTWGGCECADGCNCDSPKTLEEMNDFCRSLGDCGLKANIVGDVQQGCKVSQGVFSQEYKNKLAELAIPIKGQYADIGNLTEYLDAAGIPTEYAPGEESTIASTMNMVGMGAGVIGSAALWYAGTTYAVSSTGAGIVYTQSAAWSVGWTAFGGAAMGAAIGMMVGGYLAKMGGAPAGWSMVAMAAGAVAGAVAGYAAFSSATLTGSFAGFGPLLGLGPLGWIVLIAIVIMIIVSFAFGSNCEPIEIKFTCEPWQPPKGGDDCSKCNGDPLKPCSEYRCQSLGAACQLINKGTTGELCDAMKNDARPPVITIGNASEGTIFTPTTDGFKITKENGQCLNAYETQLISFSTNKPAQCRFDVNQVAEFGNMSASFGTAYYTYNHILPFNLPDPSHGMSQGINWSGDMTLYVLCQDAYANPIRVPYKIETCVYQGKDITPPTITKTEPATNSLLSYNTTQINFTAYTTEPATCKWSNNDEKFATMTKPMTCEQNLLNKGLYGYACKTDMPINSTQTNIYIACQDQPWLNDSTQKSTMTGNVKVILNKVASPIKIDNIAPKDDLETLTTMKTIELGVQTSAGAKWHTCSYSFSGYDNMIPFLATGERAHKQSFNLALGAYKVYVECKDETGDKVRSEANFRVIQDTSSPGIARIYRQGSSIKVITTESADCRYSLTNCGFIFTNGTTMGSGLGHSITSKGGEVYFVKCKDEFENAPSSCSVTIAGV